MSAQRLNDRSRRRIERSTGLEIVRAWAHGGYVFNFVTPEHRHGWWDKKTGEWGWDDDPVHYSSCTELFPGYAALCKMPSMGSYRMKTATFDGMVMPGQRSAPGS
jgi:hypothetical protein